MHEIQSTDAKARFAQILRHVEHGERFAITRHGKTIAHLVPAADLEGAEREAAVDRFLKERASWQPVEMTLDEILDARHAGHRL